MKREIKFRAWDRVKKKMFYIDKYHHLSIHIGGWTIGKTLRGVETSRDSSVLMQYTGMKDSKGQEIYEGDIIIHPVNGSVEDKNNTKYTVEWFRGAIMVRQICSTEKYRLFSSYKTYQHLTNIEVIGNVYENIELLTK